MATRAYILLFIFHPRNPADAKTSVRFFVFIFLSDVLTFSSFLHTGKCYSDKRIDVVERDPCREIKQTLKKTFIHICCTQNTFNLYQKKNNLTTHIRLPSLHLPTLTFSKTNALPKQKASTTPCPAFQTPSALSTYTTDWKR